MGFALGSNSRLVGLFSEPVLSLCCSEPWCSEPVTEQSAPWLENTREKEEKLVIPQGTTGTASK